MALYRTFITSGLVAALAIAQSTTINSSWVPFDRSPLPGNATLDDKGNVQLFWSIGDEYSRYAIASRSTGYLALGFSQTGAMTGADIAVGLKGDNGNFTFENRYATGFDTPEVSPDQTTNMRFVDGGQSNGTTWFIFDKKNLAACTQTQQNVATNAVQWFIYAHSNQNVFAQHASGSMGMRYIKLGTAHTISSNVARPVPNAKSFTIRQQEITIPSDETTYCYSLHKMPNGTKNFIVGERPPHSSPLLHHLVLYSCWNLPDEYLAMLSQPPNCAWQNLSNPCNGFVTEWAPGMSARTFEVGYGKPFGEDSYQYVMLETHYNNPQNVVGQKDAASYNLLYSGHRVETEVGTLTLGDLQVEGWFLEPGKDLVSHSTVCTPECTHKWPAEGITATSVFHHMHYRGRNARVQIIRNGTEIMPLSEFRNFEYGYQFEKILDNVKLLPGDKLVTTCEFDTSNDTKPVPGGFASSQEMCFAWVDYYPSDVVLACTQVDTGVMGEAAFCMTSDSPQPAIYNSSFLTSSFKALPATDKNCCATPAASKSRSSNSSILRTCPETDVCFSLNVPQQSASLGSGDVYFQLSAPTSYSWVALGQGTLMTNANIFLMYGSADGKNVTISHRTTSNHAIPTYNGGADLTLLEGSGVSNGTMVANVRCGSCSGWSAGKMDLQSGSDSDWVYALLRGSTIYSDDLNIAINKHSMQGSFQWRLMHATGGSSTNPFVSPDAANSDTKTTTSAPGTTLQSSFIRMRLAHGVLACLVFVGILPLGAIVVRLAGKPWMHGGIQGFGLAVYIIAAGLGFHLANQVDYLHETHSIAGLLLLAVLFSMPILGIMHHRIYKKMQRRTGWSYAHIFVGRVTVLLGLLNGGSGLRLAKASRGSMIAYGVLAGLIGSVYLGVALFGEVKRVKQRPKSAAAHELMELRREEGGS